MHLSIVVAVVGVSIVKKKKMLFATFKLKRF